MTAWDRINALELDIRIRDARIITLEAQLVVAEAQATRMREERDTARAFAVHLEQEVAACEGDLHTLYVLAAGDDE